MTVVPDPVVTNADLAAQGFDADWILQRTGIRERRHAPKEMATSDLACDATWRWWQRLGRRRYWHASGLLVLCDDPRHLSELCGSVGPHAVAALLPWPPSPRSCSS